MDYGKEFKKFATKDQGINSMYYDKLVSSVTPYIIEERQLNVGPPRTFAETRSPRFLYGSTGIRVATF